MIIRPIELYFVRNNESLRITHATWDTHHWAFESGENGWSTGRPPILDLTVTKPGLYIGNINSRSAWVPSGMWFLNRAEAVIAAQQERDRQLVRLRESIARYESMGWDDEG